MKRQFLNPVKKRTVMILVLFCMILALAACSNVNSVVDNESIPTNNKITIPNIIGIDENTAKTLLTSKGLLPKVEYEYNDTEKEGNVFRTMPYIGSQVVPESVVTIYVSKGPSHYVLSNNVGYIYNVNNIDPFEWGTGTTEGTKEFYAPYFDRGYLYIDIWLKCNSIYDIEFYRSNTSTSDKETFGTASIKDSFDKTVPIKVLFDDYRVNNKGEKTAFTLKIPLSDLDVQKPTNLYVKFDFLVNGKRETFTARFELSW